MFTHLHTHSDYSFLDALPQVHELAIQANILGQESVALTDRANMHGAIEFYKACQKAKVKPILGCEMFIAPRSRHDKEAGIDSKRQRIVLIAKNNAGYENLLNLVSISFQEGFYYVPRIDLEILEQYHSDLIAFIPRSGGVSTPYLETGDFEKAKECLQPLQNIFDPKDFFLETTPRPNAENEALFQKNYRTFLDQTGINPVATNDIRYLKKEESDIHDTLICMEYTLQKNDSDRISYREHDLSFWTEEQMTEYFSDLPACLENTQVIANQCHYEFTFGVNLIPTFQVPSNFKDDGELLRFMCEEGIRKRYGGTPKGPSLSDSQFYEKIEPVDPSPITEEETNLSPEQFTKITERLYFELDMIGDMGFNAYFLIVGDFVQWAKENHIAVGPGRGSAAGAIVAYLLQITDLDPLQYSLFFERFLNPERVSMPDIDIDFADSGRERVLEYVRDKYGRDKVANVCTFGTMAARAALKDVARVYGLPFSEANEFVKLIPEKPGTKLAEAYEESTELQDALKENPEWSTIFETARALEGNVRHVSVHACAVMITPEPILKYCPLQPAPKDPNTLITQYQAKPLEMLGLLKMDFLGLRNLTILENTLKNITKRHGIKIDISDIPMDDEKAFKLLTDGFTTGVFQLESAGMTRYLKELKPSQFEDLIAMVSLYRPGPMKFIPDYIAGKHGTKTVQYADPSLENILKETFGIAIYQEQILEIAKVFAGFTLGGADILRRAIGKKIASEMDAQRIKFIQGAQEQGHDETLSASIFDDVIVPFAGYGFNKSHAACYALIAYQTAYLKAHYPVEFMTALLTSDAENTDRVILDIEECRALDITVLPPSVQESDFSFSIVGENTIRFGLNAIKGIGESVVQGILDARNNGGFPSFPEFLEKCGSKIINKKSIESLAKSGALSDLERVENILEHQEKVLQFTKDNSKAKAISNESQNDLFGAYDIEVESASLDLGNEPEYSLAYQLRLEKEVLGIYVSGHPLEGMKPYFEETGTSIKKLPQSVRFSEKKKGKTQGLLTHIRKLITKKGDAMAVGSVEDLSGKLDIVVFPKSYEKNSACLIPDHFVKMEGKMEKREGEWQMSVESCEGFELEEIRMDAEKRGLLDMESTTLLDIDIEDHIPMEEDGVQEYTDIWDIYLPETITPSQIQELKTVLASHPGTTEVMIHFKHTPIPFPSAVNKTPDLIHAVQQLCGGTT